jgi:hypothetical protein
VPRSPSLPDGQRVVRELDAGHCLARHPSDNVQVCSGPTRSNREGSRLLLDAMPANFTVRRMPRVETALTQGRARVVSDSRIAFDCEQLAMGQQHPQLRDA